MLNALKQAIARHSSTLVVVQAIAATTLKETARFEAVVGNEGTYSTQDYLWCPLTLDLPETLDFPNRAAFQACGDIIGLRQQVKQLGDATGDGYFWLPIVLTAKGPLYAEVINSEKGLWLSVRPDLVSSFGQGLPSDGYWQPMGLSDALRQINPSLGDQLLQY